MPNKLTLALVVSLFITHVGAAPKYELLLQGGHLIDPRNGTSAIRDLAISAGKVAAIAPKIDPADASKAVDVAGRIRDCATSSTRLAVSTRRFGKGENAVCSSTSATAPAALRGASPSRP